MKKKNKKRKILKAIVIILIIGIITFLILNQQIKNIYVINNSILSDQEIIELAGLDDYPKLFSKSSRIIQNKIKISPYVEKVKVRKNLLGKIEIEVLEYDLILKDATDNKIYLSNLEKILLDDKIIGIPTLINYTPEDILKEFLDKLKTIDKDILSKISEIEYTPNEYDQDLFMFYMNDSNYVYITTTRLLNINKYDEVLVNLEGKKGILYLDSGNHFEILE
ncbi:MAG: FtsQ-type POTRA domain-containing protein [Bacilli bacterium]|nr:FtsQ-type POTRA domain-containing protein [Bacilli bacterium]